MTPADRSFLHAAGRCVVLGTLVLTAGCASVPGTDPSPAPEVSPGLAPIEGALLAPGPMGVVRWRSLRGLNAGTEFDVKTESSTIEGAMFATRTADIEIAYWSMSDQDGVLLHAVDSLGDKARSVFTPPLVIAPPRLGNDGCNAESSMRVLTLPRATVERERGTGTRTLRSVRDEIILIDDVPTSARLVESTFVAALGAARAERTARMWVTKDHGLVAESWREKILVLKVFPKETTQSAVRLGVNVPNLESLIPSATSEEQVPAK